MHNKHEIKNTRKLLEDNLCGLTLALTELLLVIVSRRTSYGQGGGGSGFSTRARAVPCRACLWFLRNLGSVPLSEGYLAVLGFLMLLVDDVSMRAVGSSMSCTIFVCVRLSYVPLPVHILHGDVPVPVRLARLVVLRRVLGLYRKWLEFHCQNGPSDRLAV